MHRGSQQLSSSAGHGWPRLAPAGPGWPRLVPAGHGWRRLAPAGLGWLGWRRLAPAGAGWRRLTPPKRSKSVQIGPNQVKMNTLPRQILIHLGRPCSVLVYFTNKHQRKARSVPPLPFLVHFLFPAAPAGHGWPRLAPAGAGWARLARLATAGAGWRRLAPAGHGWRRLAPAGHG